MSRDVLLHLKSSISVRLLLSSWLRPTGGLFPVFYRPKRPTFVSSSASRVKIAFVKSSSKQIDQISQYQSVNWSSRFNN